MGMTKDEIMEYASRYVDPADSVDFPLEGDLFYFLERDTVPKKKGPEAKWAFGGYGYCKGYQLDDEARPRGKWLWMSCIWLASFPPVHSSLKLQPPHVARGTFQSADRTKEIRIVRVPKEDPASTAAVEPNDHPEPHAGQGAKILSFPRRPAK